MKKNKIIGILILLVILGFAGCFKVKRENNVMIPMRDGTRLAANIYFPEELKKAPVILHRLPYGKDIITLSSEFNNGKGFLLTFYQHNIIVVLRIRHDTKIFI